MIVLLKEEPEESEGLRSELREGLEVEFKFKEG
jgi:hypothetical protein